MKEKLRDYIESVFSDAPDCRKTRELKEEMYQNLCDKYDDLISDGRSEAAAYNIAISGVGDISGIVDSLKEEYGEQLKNDSSPKPTEDNPHENPDEKTKKPEYTQEASEQIRKYKITSGILTAIAVALYILCWVPLAVLSMLYTSNFYDMVGLAVMMIMIALATGLLIFKGALKPAVMLNKKGNYSEYDIPDKETTEDKSKSKNKNKKKKNPALKAVSSALWTLTVVVYILISFITFAWHITWIIFLIAAAIDNIIDAIFEIAGAKYRD